MRKKPATPKTVIAMADIVSIETFNPSLIAVARFVRDGHVYLNVRVLAHLTSSKTAKPIWRVVYNDGRFYIINKGGKVRLAGDAALAVLDVELAN